VMYSILSRTTSNRVTLTLAAFPLDSPSRGPIWTRPIAELPADARNAKRALQLALAGSNIVVSTEAGLIAAVNRESARVAWAVQYPSRGPHGVTSDLLPVPREIGAPIVAGGTVYVAPADSPEIVALDAWTGAARWPRPLAIETVHLLGVVDQKLIATTD